MLHHQHFDVTKADTEKGKRWILMALNIKNNSEYLNSEYELMYLIYGSRYIYICTSAIGYVVYLWYMLK